MVRVLHVSDIHCDSNRLIRVLESEDYDIVAATGDFECVETVEALVKYASKPLLAVTGNIDNAATARVLRDAGVLLDGRIRVVDDLVFAGVGGLDLKSSIESLRERLAKSDVGRVDFLLSHHPPKGILDRVFIGLHIGSRDVLELAESLRPKAHLFGHVHEARGSIVRNGILFVNAGPLKRGYYAVVECTSGGCSAVHKRV